MSCVRDTRLGIVVGEDLLQGGEGCVVKVERAEPLDVEEDVEARVGVVWIGPHSALQQSAEESIIRKDDQGKEFEEEAEEAKVQTCLASHTSIV